MRIFSIFLVSIVIMTSNACSQEYDSAMVFYYGYAAASPSWHVCVPGEGVPLLIVGTVQSFDEPFTDLVPPSGTYEATYVFEGMVLVGSYSHSSPDGCSSVFDGGGFKIYIDLTPDANPADVSTYRDGELVLEATLQGEFWIDLNLGADACPHWGPSQFASFIFSGGSWFSHVSDENGQGYWAHNEGCFWTGISEELIQMGYMGRSTSWMNVQAPVSTESSTWGKVKALYR
jgi:hypothetical protein